MSCLEVVNDLIESVNKVNTEITFNMTQENVRYEDVCIRPDATFKYYTKSLKTKWDRIINEYISRPDKCPTNLQRVLLTYDIISRLGVVSGEKESLSKILNKLGSMPPEQIQDVVYDRMIEEGLNMLNGDKTEIFETSDDAISTLKNLALTLSKNCNCQTLDIFMFIMNKYKKRYSKKLVNKNRFELINIIKKDYEYLKTVIEQLATSLGLFTPDTNINDKQSTKSTKSTQSAQSLLNFSLEKEMEKLIPNELGSMKDFFIKVISRYFNNLHPIIWAQIVKGLMMNIFIDLPTNFDELFGFISKQLLLNSGPFILKILQMIRPALSEELAKKYNLINLTYPLLELNQVDLILRRVLINYDMFEVIYNKSASVGHICIGHDVRTPEKYIVIKIIKPLAIAQSCWEYYVLNDLFERGSCEDDFIKNTLKANGKEMNVSNEIANLDRSYSNYTTNYMKEFGIDIDAKLTTISHIPGIVTENAWFALATTFAPGIPLADLIESNVLTNDTKFRAHLHRCLDLLVVKFFYVLISQGFYHGDLHAGNIFYSFKQKTMTMIDFGAMGDIDLFSNNDTTTNLLTIIIKSIMYDYDGILDLLTNILNSKCTESGSLIDKNDTEYKNLKELLISHKITKILFSEKERDISAKYLQDLTGEKRLKDEHVDDIDTLQMLKSDSTDETAEPSIYDRMEYVRYTKDVIVENKDILPVFTEIVGKSESISFAGVMQLIIKYYAQKGVNVAIKFAELNELQKAYTLLLGVLAKTSYNSYRMNMAMRSAILSWKHLSKIYNVRSTANIISIYWSESSRSKEFREFVMREYELFKQKAK